MHCPTQSTWQLLSKDRCNGPAWWCRWRSEDLFANFPTLDIILLTTYYCTMHVSLTGIHTLVKRNVKKLRSLLSSECFSSFLSTLSMCARINYILSRNLYLGTISIDIHRSLFILRFISFYNVINKLIKQYLFASVQALHASIINSWIRGYLLKKLIKS